MVGAMSNDYRFIMGKLSMDFSFAEKFFESAESVLANFNITSAEREKLLGIKPARFEAYRKVVALRSGDCDSCCNGGDPSGSCSECSASCCQ